MDTVGEGLQAKMTAGGLPERSRYERGPRARKDK